MLNLGDTIMILQNPELEQPLRSSRQDGSTAASTGEKAGNGTKSLLLKQQTLQVV